MSRYKYIIINSPLILWSLNPSEPAYARIKYLFNSDLLSPVRYFNAYHNLNLIGGINNSNEIQIIKSIQRIHLTTKGIVFRIKTSSPKIDINEFNSKLSILFKFVKVNSNQFSLPNNFYSSFVYFEDKIDLRKRHFTSSSHKFYYEQNRIYLTRLDWATLKTSIKQCNKELELPVFDLLFLDAINENGLKEYTKSILTIAMCIESYYSNFYNTLYQKAQKRGTGKYQGFKIVNIDNKLCDPIFEKLVKENNIKRYFHIIPFYLNGNSLMISNRKLYDNLIKLFETRNKIVHGDWYSSSSKVLSQNEAGATKALEILKEFLKEFKQKSKLKIVDIYLHPVVIKTND